LVRCLVDYYISECNLKGEGDSISLSGDDSKLKRDIWAVGTCFFLGVKSNIWNLLSEESIFLAALLVKTPGLFIKVRFAKFFPAIFSFYVISLAFFFLELHVI